MNGEFLLPGAGLLLGLGSIGWLYSWVARSLLGTVPAGGSNTNGHGHPNRDAEFGSKSRPYGHGDHNGGAHRAAARHAGSRAIYGNYGGSGSRRATSRSGPSRANETPVGGWPSDRP